MALSPLGRKHLLPWGKQDEIAKRLGVIPGYVSQVVNGLAIPRSKRGWKLYRKVQVAIARALGMRLDEAFTPRELGIEQQQDAA